MWIISKLFHLSRKFHEYTHIYTIHKRIYLCICVEFQYIYLRLCISLCEERKFSRILNPNFLFLVCLSLDPCSDGGIFGYIRR